MVRMNMKTLGEMSAWRSDCGVGHSAGAVTGD